MKWSAEHLYDQPINAAALQYGVPASLIKAIIGQESGFNPRAFRAEPSGKVGSFGLMQLLPATAKAYGFTGPDDLLYDPWSNVLAGTAYLADCLKRTGGNVAAAVSAYNGGFRPALGFGATVTKTTTVALARDAKGNPTVTFTAQPGQYGNQDYVDRVLANQTYFLQVAATGTPDTPPTPSAPGGSFLSPGAVIGGTAGAAVLLVAVAALFLLRGK